MFGRKDSDDEALRLAQAAFDLNPRPPTWLYLSPAQKTMLRHLVCLELIRNHRKRLPRLSDPDGGLAFSFDVVDRRLSVSLGRRHEGEGLVPNPASLAQLSHQGRVLHGTDRRGRWYTSDAKNFARGATILGVSGSGKSHYSARLFAQLAAKGPALALDWHGDAVHDVPLLVPPDRVKDIVVVRPGEEGASWGTNVFQELREAFGYTGRFDEAIEDVAYNVADFLGIAQRDVYAYEQGPAVRGLLTLPLLAAAEWPTPSLVDTYSMLQNPDEASLVADWATRDDVRNHLGPFYRSLSADFRFAGINKLIDFRNPHLANLLCRRRPSSTLRQLFGQNKIVLVDLSDARIGSLRRLMSFMIMQIAIKIAEASPQPAPLTILAEEFSDYATIETSKIIDKLRKKNLQFIAVVQSLSKLDPGVASALTRAGHLAVFRSDLADAETITPLIADVHYPVKLRATDVRDLPTFHFIARAEQPYAYGPGTAPDLIELDTVPPLEPWQTDHERSAKVLFQSQAIKAPFDKSDLEPIWKRTAVHPSRLLQVLAHAEEALRNPAVFHEFFGARSGAESDPTCRKTFQQAQWSLKAGLLTAAVPAAIVQCQGATVQPPDLDHFVRLLIGRGWLRMLKHDVSLASGPVAVPTLEFTAEGRRRVEWSLSPGSTPNEGRHQHRELVKATVKALWRAGPFRVNVPDQATNEYRPDVEVPMGPGSSSVDQVPGHGSLSKSLHMNVEVSTQKTPEKILQNVENCLAANATPGILIAAGPSVEAAFAGLHDFAARLEAKLRPSPERLRGPAHKLLASAGLDSVRWFSLLDGKLVEFIRAAQTLQEVGAATVLYTRPNAASTPTRDEPLTPPRKVEAPVQREGTGPAFSPDARGKANRAQLRTALREVLQALEARPDPDLLCADVMSHLSKRLPDPALTTGEVDVMMRDQYGLIRTSRAGRDLYASP